jgi:hypothetical protein
MNSGHFIYNNQPSVVNGLLKDLLASSVIL